MVPSQDLNWNTCHLETYETEEAQVVIYGETRVQGNTVATKSPIPAQISVFKIVE